MQSTLRDGDPHDIFVIEPDVVLAARADHPASAAHDARGRAATPPVDTSFRASEFRATDAADVHVANDHNPLAGDRPSSGKWMKRALLGFMFALASAGATAAWEHYGDRARATLANWTPPFVLATSPATEKPASAGPASSDGSAAAAEQTAAAPAPAADAPATAVVSSDSAQLLQSMARDIAALGQQVTQLKASIEQLRDGQAQMSRDMAKSADARMPDASLRPKLASTAPPAPPRPAAPVVHKPKPPVQAAAAPLAPPPQPLTAPAPIATAPQPPSTAQDGGPVVRPPLPLR